MNTDDALRVFIGECSELLRDIEDILSPRDCSKLEPEWIDALFYTADILKAVKACLIETAQGGSGLPIGLTGTAPARDGRARDEPFPLPRGRLSARNRPYEKGCRDNHDYGGQPLAP